MSTTPPDVSTDDPHLLEVTYRTALGNETTQLFRSAMGKRLAQQPDNPLVLAWAARLDLPAPDTSARTDSEETGGGAAGGKKPSLWPAAIFWAFVTGVGMAFLPLPDTALSVLWTAWSPMIAAGVALYLASLAPRRRKILLSSIPALALAWAITFSLSHAADESVATLSALHLPLLVWGLLGAAMVFGEENPATQMYAYIVKSLEVILTGGIYFAAMMLFIGLTIGIFSALDVDLPEALLERTFMWGTGAVPILAVASVYAPGAAPAAQDFGAGLAQTLQILTRLLLVPALFVLAVYLAIFIPMNFFAAFEERNVLIVYNATIVAIVALIAAATSGSTMGADRILFYGVLCLTLLTALLNLYALAAIVSRTLELGFTPNRHAVLGWNVITLVMLVAMASRAWRAKGKHWVESLRATIATVTVLPLLWAAWIVAALPLIHTYLDG